jgi:hypothetical protein
MRARLETDAVKELLESKRELAEVEELVGAVGS